VGERRGDPGRAETLAGRLRTWAAGPEARTAVDQLITGGWLGDEVFVGACVVPVEGDLTVAVVDWAALAQHAHRLEERGEDRGGELWQIYATAARAWGGFVREDDQ
jgi:hypothetical protein